MGGVRAGIMHGIVSGTMSWVVSEALIASQVGPGGERGGGGWFSGERGLCLSCLCPPSPTSLSVTLNTKLQRSRNMMPMKLPVGRTLLPAGRPTSCVFLGQLPGGQCLHT